MQGHFKLKREAEGFGGKDPIPPLLAAQTKRKDIWPPPGARIGEKMNSLLELPEGSSPVNP